MLENIYISDRFFTIQELEKFEYKISSIAYSSSAGEIDFSSENEKTFLLEKGYPKILARFFA
ncbi:hypothetical protein NG800_012960 [Epilithonimonas ginsengisoli]|uniref:Uncharacterized protein n=1 Tax=Epilithonimonas ginsengisoli TaxID=1245592 RepID=A0ABU4JJV5_9FLAO|nr:MULTISPECIES: hypothetical protein [Chryseobacterium group]MBV6880939.1 hypothetical protein [Epilithonimonas sp. FP105]MDW8549828.1 hypothetical protein [Epilithonimonas ginsengisoli]OAH73581.1 hypothetical protein AXA65_07535 [Chryseobacterium sp. FP211-J200]